MTDIHSHLIYRMDDGARDLEESIALLKEAEAVGIQNIIATPHYREENDQQAIQIEEKVALLQNRANQEQLSLKIYSGNVIPVESNVAELLYEKRVLPLADSQYVLINLGKCKKQEKIEQCICEVIEEGYTPIFSGPELCPVIQEDFTNIIKWMEKGVLFQSNLGSILGIYGKEAKKTFLQLLDHRMIQFLAFNVHRKGTIYPQFSEIEKNVKKILTEEEWDELLIENPKKILQKEEIHIKMPEDIDKKQFWDFLK